MLSLNIIQQQDWMFDVFVAPRITLSQISQPTQSLDDGLDDGILVELQRICKTHTKAEGITAQKHLF